MIVRWTVFLQRSSVRGGESSRCAIRMLIALMREKH